MIKEAYCSYEIAKLLKEKGFDEPCLQAWVNEMRDKDNDKIQYRFQSRAYQNLLEEDECLSPTHQMACAWLREKGYHIYTFNLDPFWIYEIQSLTKDWTFSFGGFENHDAAIEAAIKYCLENLI